MCGHLKSREIASLIATQTREVSQEVTATLRRMRRPKRGIAPCHTQVELWP
jgi:hypothetical protein